MNWKQTTFKFKLGIILILVSIIFFVLLVIIPLSNFSKPTKITLASVSFILAEVLFYTGGFFIGKELFNKYKAWFNPKNWIKKNHKKQLEIINEPEKTNDL